MSLCCFEPPYGKLYLVSDAADWWREYDLERRHRKKVRGRRFFARHNLAMFAIPPCERDMF